MGPSKVAPPGARLPLLVLAGLLALGAGLWIRLHVHPASAEPASPAPAVASGVR